MEWYRESVKNLSENLKTDLKNGLSEQEAKNRLITQGKNILVQRPPEHFLTLFFKQIHNTFTYLLLVAALLKYFVEGYRDAIIILMVVAINALVSAFQEGKASQTLVKLRQFLTTDCIVIRDGVKQLINQEDLVVGDLIVLREGMRVPADARIIESAQLYVDESLLTGESTPVAKDAEILEKTALPLFDQKNSVFTGTTVTSGTAHAIVIATGTKTAVGHLSCSLDSLEIDMPLKRDLAYLSIFLLRTVIIIVVFFVLIGLARGKEFAELIFTMTSLLVSIVPEGIPIVSTILMARNAYRMAQSHVLVKNLQAIDGLGRVQVLVVDKTGTLTKNEQMVAAFCVDGRIYRVSGSGYQSKGTVSLENSPISKPEAKTSLWYFGSIASLLDTTERIEDEKTGTIRLKGEPILTALGICAHKLGIDQSETHELFHKIKEFPFDPEKRVGYTVFSDKNGTFLHVLFGSPEEIHSRCGKREVTDGLQLLLNEGYRTLAIAYAIRTSQTKSEAEDWICGGTIGLQDTLREDAAKSMQQVEKLGVRVIIATGDHLETARHVAQAVGIKNTQAVIEGKEITAQNMDSVAVIARVTPENKLSIIQLLHSQNKIVGMTGDGINDVPALAAADVGIAMGHEGTDIAKEASDIVLLDDSLSSIAEGIRLGRHAFLTMRQVFTFILSTSAGEILVIATALIANIPLPLLATQILWVHLLTDGCLDIALGMEPVDSVTTAAPLKSQMRLIDRSLARSFFVTSIPVAAITIGLFWHYLPDGLEKARTIALTTLAMCQWWNVWNMRSESRSIFTQNPFSNGWLVASTCFVVIAQLSALYLPFLQKVLYTMPLTLHEIMACLGLSALVLVFEEVRKGTVILKKMVMKKTKKREV